MRINPKLAAFALLTATAAFAGSSDYHWDEGHKQYHYGSYSICKLKLEDIYQPMGGSQPIHLKIRNISHNRLTYRANIRVGSFDAGSIFVDNANENEQSDRDANKRFPGNLNGSSVSVTITSCSIRQ